MILGGCSSESAAPSGKGPVRIQITERNGSIQPRGDTVRAGTGEPVVLVVDSDAADEIHVHSEPDHEFMVNAGHKQTFRFSIGDPGTYEVESHGLDVVIVKLQVS
jgi:hypothetical protein